METRKVQLSGGTTYTVSLPKSWANEHGVDTGSVLSLHPNGDGSLLVEAVAGRETADRTTTLDVSTNDEEAVRQRVRAAHAIGVDSVTLADSTGHPPDRRQSLERTLSRLSGFELLEATDRRIRLTNLIDAENVDIRKSTLRLRLVMLSMHRDAVTAVAEGDEELAERVVERDDEADKLFAMVTRHFRRSLSDLREVEKLEWSRDDLFEYYYTARQFERVADHAEKIAQFSLEPDLTFPPEFADRLTTLGDAARRVVDDAADVVLDGAGLETATGAISKRDRLMDRLEAFDRELYDHDVAGEAYVLGLLLDSLRRTVEYGANVADIALQRVTRADA
ncbi:MAG: PhoU domain-containing protein [Haloferacaceae archaeon]